MNDSWLLIATDSHGSQRRTKNCVRALHQPILLRDATLTTDPFHPCSLVARVRPGKRTHAPSRCRERARRKSHGLLANRHDSSLYTAGILLDQEHVEAAFFRGDRRRQAARPGADDQHITVCSLLRVHSIALGRDPALHHAYFIIKAHDAGFVYIPAHSILAETKHTRPCNRTGLNRYGSKPHLPGTEMLCQIPYKDRSCDEGKPGGNRGKREIHMTAYQVDRRRIRALIGDVNEPVLRHLLQ